MNRNILFASIAVLALEAAAASHAQAQTAAPAAAAQPGSDASTVGAIIVTAQRRSQKLLDVPIAIQATAGSELRTRQITTVEGLVQLIPDLRIGSAYQSVNQDITIRGIGPANQYNFNTNAPVGLYMDEVYQTFQASPGLQLFDLDRVEVLKGPQGTLYGRNTTGGAVNFITKNPSLNKDALNGNLAASVGNYEHYDVEGGSDITVIDGVLGARVSGFYSNGDGYIKNLAKTGPRTYGSDDTAQGRLVVRYVPSPIFDATLKVYLNRFQGSTPGALEFGVGPGGANALGYSRAGLNNQEVDFNYAGSLKTVSDDVGLTMNWNLGKVKVTSVTATERSSAHISNDCDGSPFDICDADYNLHGSQYSEDLRAQYSDGPLNITAGGFYGADTYHHLANVGFFGAAFLQNTYNQVRRSYAFYVDGTYNFTDQLSLTLGLRETQDETRISRLQTALLSSLVGTPVALSIPASATFDPNAFLPAVERDSNGLTGRAVLSYKFTPQVMAYVSYSHGYRAGAFNGQQFFSANELNYVGPETDDNYELGLKGAFFERRLQLTSALFDTEIRNQQVLSAVNIPGVASYPALAGLNGRVRGFEIDAQGVITETLRGHVAFTWLDTRYDNGQVTEGVDVGGHRFPFAPDYSLRAGLDWRLWEAGERKLTLSGDVDYTGHYYYDPQNGVGSVGAHFKNGQEGYALVDTRLTYDMGRVQVTLWAKNLFDKFYLTYVSNAESSFGSDFGIRGVPRTFGVSANVSF
jgi:outer membrane receptor protein involved in Fe transport